MKVAVAQLGAYDKAISEQQVDYQSADAELATVNAKINEQKAGSLAYNINDNKTVQDIRDQIVAKEVEIVKLRQQYTDKHPSVIAARQALAALQQNLKQEVGAVVASEATSLNPTQSALMTQQAQASAKKAVAEAARSALESERDKQDAKMGSLPDDIMKYVQLQSDAKIKREVYTNLVQQRENKSIQEAMESMDIQIIDEADLPDVTQPAFPKRLRMIAIGGILGIILSFGYTMVYYKRQC